MAAATFRAAVVRAAGAPLRVEPVTFDEPAGGNALVRVTACGLCHSDLHFMAGTSGRDFPYLVGHEVTGVVERVGPDVTGLSPGDTVVVAPMVACGTCRQCRAGRAAACPAKLPRNPAGRLADGAAANRVLGIGGLAERVVLPARQLVPVDPRLPPAIAALLGCAVPSGFGAAVHTARVGPADDVVVIGCGGVGVAAVAGAAHAGARRVVAVDANPRKLPAAKRFGATDVVDAGAVDAAEAVRELTGGAGADVVIDAVGGARTFTAALAMRGPGSRVVVVGAPQPGEVAELGLRPLFLTGGRIQVSIWGDCVASRDIPLLAGLYLSGKLPLEVGETFGLDAAGDGYHSLEAGETLRPVVVF
ncbi:alcohol dehydrogenase catalytic domain-containing protein [Phytohabitans sp. ZYX-F-186]|uniref:Alcohol dehydrogenase catalytic domain-containing protein n=1 Tax=Phytohabitans maris TaxID=3071409 RepID=A0ABU0ZT08_9ACTN|nr:zinc-binding dehydrogenase [Phytohabitans sp. ZYX-F-186]MDQ7910166.1 alcohol dehydrogenase catalytic domain-containing protein [Phytohabitans sp. ZYX-F-186]